MHFFDNMDWVKGLEIKTKNRDFNCAYTVTTAASVSISMSTSTQQLPCYCNKASIDILLHKSRHSDERSIGK